MIEEILQKCCCHSCSYLLHYDVCYNWMRLQTVARFTIFTEFIYPSCRPLLHRTLDLWSRGRQFDLAVSLPGSL